MEDTPGAIIQLLSRGPQEHYYLDGESDHFRTVFRRSSQFSSEHRGTPFPLGFVLGKTCSLEVPKNCDMLGDMSIEVVLPSVPGASQEDVWHPLLAYHLLRRVRVYIDEYLIVDSERLWRYVHDQVYEKHRVALWRLMGVGRHMPLTEEHRITIPLHMPWKFLPLISMHRSEMRMEVQVETFERCIVRQSPFTHRVGELRCEVVSQCIFLEQRERFTFIGQKIGLPIRYIQDMETTFPHHARQVQVDMSEIVHPVTALLWVTYPVGDRSFSFVENSSLQDWVVLNGQKLTTPSAISSLARRYYLGETVSANDSVHMLSFTLHPTDIRSSASLNFGKVPSRPILLIDLNPSALKSGGEFVTKVFAQTTRILVLFRGKVIQYESNPGPSDTIASGSGDSHRVARRAGRP